MQKNIFIFLSFCLTIFMPVFVASASNSLYRIEDAQIQELPDSFSQPQIIANQKPYQIYYPFGQAQINQIITPITIEYGSLSPGEPILRNQQIAVSKNYKAPYKIYIAENHPLQSTASALIQIPNTTCDQGGCTSYTAAAWISLLTYGFGFRCVGTYCINQFIPDNFYMQLSPDQSLREVINIPEQAGAVKNSLLYKVNSSPTTKVNTYTNTISIIGLPGF